jgi:hypothetical protein
MCADVQVIRGDTNGCLHCPEAKAQILKAMSKVRLEDDFVRAVQPRCRFTVAALVCAAVCIAPVISGAQGRTFDLLSASIADIQDAVDAGALTYERLVRLYLNRIEAYDQKGPHLRAVLAVTPRAIEIARGLDRERKISGRRGLLHGIPVAVKDNIDARYAHDRRQHRADS